MDTSSLTFGAAFVAGVLTFFSPCIFPLIPAYVSYVSGLSIDELRRGDHRVLPHVAVRMTLFIIGFSVVFVMLGATASAVGGFLLSYRFLLMRVMGVVIIVFGLLVLDVFDIPALARSRNVSIGERFRHLWFFPLLLGMGFAFGWTPCAGPILGSILLVAGSSASVSTGVAYLALYSLGLAAPLFATAMLLSAFLTVLARLRGFLRAVNIFAGVILIAFGLLLVLAKQSLLLRLMP